MSLNSPSLFLRTHQFSLVFLPNLSHSSEVWIAPFFDRWFIKHQIYCDRISLPVNSIAGQYPVALYLEGATGRGNSLTQSHCRDNNL